MRHPLVSAVMIGSLIIALWLYWKFVNAMVGAYGFPAAIIIVLICYALACQIHRRERGY